MSRVHDSRPISAVLAQRRPTQRPSARAEADPGSHGRPRGRAVAGVLGLLIALLTLLVPAVPAAAVVGAPADSEDGLLLRINGDAGLGASESVGAAIVVQGDLTVLGEAKVVVVVNGTATLQGARVGTLVVVDGAAVLRSGTVVTGDVVVPNSTVAVDGTSWIDGDIVDDLSGFNRAFSAFNVVFSVAFAVGAALVTLIGALVFAAIGPGTARAAIRGIRADAGRVALSGLVFWIALPLLGVPLLLSVIGAPTAFAIWFVVLPGVAFLGYLVTGIWIGQLLVDRQGERHHPYAAAALGTVILIGVGIIPLAGALVALAASLVGGSALAWTAWQAVQSGQAPRAPQPAPMSPPGGAPR